MGPVNRRCPACGAIGVNVVHRSGCPQLAIDATYEFDQRWFDAGHGPIRRLWRTRPWLVAEAQEIERAGLPVDQPYIVGVTDLGDGKHERRFLDASGRMVLICNDTPAT